MPYVPPVTIDAIKKEHRRKLQVAMMERAVMSYSFSYEKLHKALFSLRQGKLEDVPIHEILEGCVVAFNDDKEKSIREELNETIAGEFKLAGVKTMRHNDPFGRPKDFIVMEGTSTSFSKQKAMDILVAKGVPADTISTAYERATSHTKFTTIQARDVKEKPEAE